MSVFRSAWLSYTQTCPQICPQILVQVGRHEDLTHLKAIKSCKTLAHKSDVGQIIDMATRVDASRLAEALETQQMLLREEQAQTAAIAEEAERAKEVWRKLVSDHEKSVEKQGTLSRSILLFQDALASIPNATISAATTSTVVPGSPDGRMKPARVGKIHYRMLVALRDLGPISLYDLIARSQASIRRIKPQMADDIAEGIVTFEQELYQITDTGLDLLRRFEEYRRANNKPLPPLEISPEEAKREESEGDRQEEAEPDMYNQPKEES